MDKQDKIQAFLTEIEKQYQINIILAIESGRRAWGWRLNQRSGEIYLIRVLP